PTLGGIEGCEAVISTDRIRHFTLRIRPRVASGRSRAALAQAFGHSGICGFGEKWMKRSSNNVRGTKQWTIVMMVAAAGALA
ncbi:hypothetical protein, partial [Klebsiella oxytoca]|uniref:hypothetical protein n=1 Tax=Klebsiella oxytoca TaxID=571 RepID=UPI001952F370